MFHGFYFDGKTAARVAVEVEPGRDALHLKLGSGHEHVWPYGELRHVQGFYRGEPIRLERGGELPEAVVVADPAFARALRDAAGARTLRFKLPQDGHSLAVKGAVAAVGLAAMLAATYLWGIPAGAAFAAQRVPPSWESALGAKVIEGLAEGTKPCASPELATLVEGIVARLAAAEPNTPYAFRVTLLDDPTINAMAAPGGHLVVFRGLLEKLESGDALAGILAHEVKHVTLRHTTQALLRQLGMTAGLALMTGGVDAAWVGSAAQTLGTLQMSRSAESEADREGLELLLRAGHRGEGMVEAFGVLAREGAELPEALTWMSTHPDTALRQEALRTQLGGRKPLQVAPPLPSGEAWRALVAACSGGAVTEVTKE